MNIARNWRPDSRAARAMFFADASSAVHDRHRLAKRSAELVHGIDVPGLTDRGKELARGAAIIRQKM